MTTCQCPLKKSKKNHCWICARFSVHALTFDKKIAGRSSSAPRDSHLWRKFLGGNRRAGIWIELRVVLLVERNRIRYIVSEVAAPKVRATGESSGRRNSIVPN